MEFDTWDFSICKAISVLPFVSVMKPNLHKAVNIPHKPAEFLEIWYAKMS
jgi:hypothetical protein